MTLRWNVDLVHEAFRKFGVPAYPYAPDGSNRKPHDPACWCWGRPTADDQDDDDDPRRTW